MIFKILIAYLAMAPGAGGAAIMQHGDTTYQSTDTGPSMLQLMENNGTLQIIYVCVMIGAAIFAFMISHKFKRVTKP